MLRALLVAGAVLVAAMIACDSTKPDTGLDALLVVSGGQFFREAMPAATDGPSVITLTIDAAEVAGASDRGAAGEGEPAATAFAVAITGDIGYWVVDAGIPSLAAPNQPTFGINYALSRSIAPGRHEFVVRAVDGLRRFGPPLAKAFNVLERGVAQGQLVVSLTWDNAANLDLHVVDPNGVEIFKRDLNSFSPGLPGSMPPGAPHDGGVLDFDSDGNCVYDGLSAENVIWADPPPKGHYLARVDTFSLCGAPAAHWKLQAFLQGVRIGASEGIGTEADTQFNHDRGAGVLALELDVP